MVGTPGFLALNARKPPQVPVAVRNVTEHFRMPLVVDGLPEPGGLVYRETREDRKLSFQFLLFSACLSIYLHIYLLYLWFSFFFFFIAV